MQLIFKKYDFMIKNVCRFFSSNKIQVGCFILYKIMVDILYILYSGRTMEYGIQISPLNIISSYLCVILYSYFICMNGNSQTFSALLMIFLNMTYFIPITTYCSLGPGSSSFFFFAIIYWGFLSYLQIKIPVVRFRRKESVLLDRLFYLLFLAIAVLTIYISAKYTGFRIITDLLNVYEARTEASSYNMPTWLVYLQNFSTILIPLMILFSFCKKKYFFAVAGCFLLLLNFSFAGHKSVLFMGILLIAGYLFWRKEMISLIVPGGTLIGIFAILEERLFQQAYINSFFFRREGFVLAALSDNYYRYFKHNPTDLFRSTFLGKLGWTSPYNQTIPKVIGNNYMTQVIGCNNGMLGDVWGHLGMIGIVIMPIILIVCFRMFDTASYGLNTKYLIGICIYYAVGFANSTWSTILLSHGFLIACMVFFLFPRENNT